MVEENSQACATIEPFPRNGDGFLRPPSLEELNVHPEILAAAEEIIGSLDNTELSLFDLERLVRVVLWADRVLAFRSGH